jgi:hypothetical protein
MLRTLLRAHSFRRSTPCRTIHNLPKSNETQPVPTRTAYADAPNRRTRGGQNLSARYRRLEASLREKGALAQAIADSPSPTTGKDGSGSELKDLGELPRPPPRTEKVEMFRGFIVPEVPQEPGPEGMFILLLTIDNTYLYLSGLTECCMSGCAICVNDLYADALTSYQNAVGSLRSSLISAGIPEAEWPTKVQVGTKAASGGASGASMGAMGAKAGNVALSAFEEMERALAAKKAKMDQMEATGMTS